MQSIVEYLFGAANFVPHGVCLLWRPDLVAIHAVSDILIFAAYASIPAALVVFVRRRRDLEARGTVLLFAMFIMACGLTHLMAFVTLWEPYYGLQGLVKVATAVISVVTAVMIWPLIPKLLRIPSPSSLQMLNRELEAANQTLTTEIEERQETLRQLNAMRIELEQRVDERTRELALANRRLERMNSDLSTFVHVASHDLKEPLRGIRHYAEIITEDNEELLTPDIRRDLTGISRLADRMSSMIDGLRAFSRAGSVEEAIEEIDLNEILNEAKDNLSPLLLESGTVLETPRPLPTIRCAHVHALALLQNLIANAASHAGKNGVRVTVEAEEGVEGVIIRVSDNGPGIPVGMRSDVFRMFRRVKSDDISGEDDKDRNSGSAGMGLAIVKRIIDRYNRTVSVGDSPIGGAQFELLLRPA